MRRAVPGPKLSYMLLVGSRAEPVWSGMAMIESRSAPTGWKSPFPRRKHFALRAGPSGRPAPTNSIERIGTIVGDGVLDVPRPNGAENPDVAGIAGTENRLHYPAHFLRPGWTFGHVGRTFWFCGGGRAGKDKNAFVKILSFFRVSCLILLGISNKIRKSHRKT